MGSVLFFFLKRFLGFFFFFPVMESPFPPAITLFQEGLVWDLMRSRGCPSECLIILSPFCCLFGPHPFFCLAHPDFRFTPPALERFSTPQPLPLQTFPFLASPALSRHRMSPAKFRHPYPPALLRPLAFFFSNFIVVCL